MGPPGDTKLYSAKQNPCVRASVRTRQRSPPERAPQAPKGEGKWQVSTNGAVMPLWSRDGREIFYFAPDDHLSSASISSEGDSPVSTNARDLFWVPLVASSNWAYDISNDGQNFLVNTVINSAVAEPISLVENWDAALKQK